MRRWLDQLEQFAIDVILERRYGKRAALLRWFLFGLSHLYAAAVQLRLWLFRKRLWRETSVGVLVISIGNLTVGGTGKTPVVEKLARTLRRGGRRVAILSRGYKSRKTPLLRRLADRLAGKAFAPRVVSDGRAILLDSRRAGDEPYMLAVNLREVVVLVDKNRVASAIYAVEKLGCDTLLLDDGMQFISLKHRMDIVLIDRQAPFGNEFLLPRGTLREPPRNLRRASTIMITKSRPGQPGGNADLIGRIRQFNRTAEIIECAHRPLYLQNVATGERQPLAWLAGRRVGTLSGIASPESFERALEDMGATIEVAKRFADHHRFSRRELAAFLDRCDRLDVDCAVTTEKDSVRLPQLPGHRLPLFFLRVEIEILRGAESWEALVDRICRQQPVVPPERFFA